jgi:thymidylate synthase (FAD)
MDVSLLSHTPDPERAVAVAARLCYAPESGASLMEDMSGEDVLRVLRIILGSGHHSALEHASFTFSLEGVSRAMTHQLVRHRLASYNQQSQRYVTYMDELEFVRPGSVAASEGFSERFDEMTDAAFALYKEMVDAGIPAEDARYVLPQAGASSIVVTMNARELMHFLTLRCCKRAQWEIRDVALVMLDLAEPVAPYVFMDAGAACRRGPCPEGRLSCGDPYPKAPSRT